MLNGVFVKIGSTNDQREDGQRSCLTALFLRSPYVMRRFTTLPANRILVLLLTSCQSAPSFEPLNGSLPLSSPSRPRTNRGPRSYARPASSLTSRNEIAKLSFSMKRPCNFMHTPACITTALIDFRISTVDISLNEKRDMSLHYNPGCALVRANRIAGAIPELQQAYRPGKPPAIIKQRQLAHNSLFQSQTDCRAFDRIL